jgi:mono/diheme cytochrome c family protein
MSYFNERRFRLGRTPMTGLITLLLVAFSVVGLAAHRSPPESECPQPRFTGKAPADLYARVNPLEANRRNRGAGEELFEDVSNPSCVACHGKNGEGDGQLSGQFDPPPRNFACAATIDGIPDGQLHWIILNGSPGTAMPSFDYFSDEEIWQLVIYLRSMTDHD